MTRPHLHMVFCCGRECLKYKLASIIPEKLKQHITTVRHSGSAVNVHFGEAMIIMFVTYNFIDQIRGLRPDTFQKCWAKKMSREMLMELVARGARDIGKEIEITIT